MHIKSATVSGISRLAPIAELSKQAKQRLKWFGYYREHGGNARLTCRHFDISPQTFPPEADWKRRYSPRDLKTWEDRSRRPSPPLAGGRDKLAMLLRRDGYQCSTSMVGRTIRRLRDRGCFESRQKSCFCS